MQITMQGRALALGLDWYLEASAKDAGKVLKGLGKPMYVKRKVMSKKILLGVLAGKDLAKKVYSAALLLASHSKNCLCIHQVSDNEFWVCAIQDGVPLSGFDVIADSMGYRQKVNEAMMFLPEAVLIGNVPGVSLSLEEALASLKKKEVETALLFSPRLALRKTAAVGAGVGAVALACWAGYTHITSKRDFEREMQAQNQAAMLDMMAQRQEQERLAKLRAEFQTQVEAAKKDLSFYVPPAEQMGAWLDVVRALPAHREGYQLAAVGCVPARCSAVWVSRSAWVDPAPEEFSEAAGFVSGVSLPGGDVVDVPPNQFAFTQVIPVPLIQKHPLPSDVVHDQALSTAKLEYVRRESALKSAGFYAFDIEGKAEEVVVTPPKELQGAQPVQVGVGNYVRFSTIRAGNALANELFSIVKMPMTLEAASFKSFAGGSPALSVVGLFKTPVQN